MATNAGTGLDRWTGRPVSGWDHVVLCLQAIFSTPFGARVMRRWFGSLIPNMLGKNIEPNTLLRFFTALYAALNFEPRFALTKINILSTPDDLRAGMLRLELVGQYRPRAHLGDFTVEGGKRLVLAANDNTTTIMDAA